MVRPGWARFRTLVAYRWANPVKHGLVEHPADWPYSSLHRDLATGQAGPEWRLPTLRSLTWA